MPVPTYDKFIEPVLRYLGSIPRAVMQSQLMIDHGVGVSHRAVKVPKLDSDYFEE